MRSQGTPLIASPLSLAIVGILLPVDQFGLYVARTAYPLAHDFSPLARRDSWHQILLI
jgi:hypothetical protein